MKTKATRLVSEPRRLFFTVACATGLFLSGAGAAEPVKKEEWNTAGIGEILEEGTFLEEGETLTLTGVGRISPWTRDAMFFVYRELTGDFTIQARVDSLEGPADQSAALLMAREGLGPDFAFAAVSLRKRHGLAAMWRETTGNAMTEKRVWGPTPPRWIRLERVGNEFRTFSSDDGGDWKELHFQEISLPETLQVGLGVVSDKPAESATAIFNDLVITQP